MKCIVICFLVLGSFTLTSYGQSQEVAGLAKSKVRIASDDWQKTERVLNQGDTVRVEDITVNAYVKKYGIAIPGRTKRLTKVTFGEGYKSDFTLSADETVHIIDLYNKKCFTLAISGKVGEVLRSDIDYKQEEIDKLEVYRKAHPLDDNIKYSRKQSMEGTDLLSTQHYEYQKTIDRYMTRYHKYKKYAINDYLFGIGFIAAQRSMYLMGLRNSQVTGTMAVGLTLTGALCIITGNVNFLRAHDARMKAHRATFQPASEGLGIALNF